MNRLFTGGDTLMKVHYKSSGATFHFSVVSRRAAKLILTKSKKGEWHVPAAGVWPYIEAHGHLIVGLSSAGFGIAIRDWR
jgi:hypothetical protein